MNIQNVLFFKNFADIVVCMWVISELEFIGKSRWARSLEAYWQDRDITNLVDILEAAQFPEPMQET